MKILNSLILSFCLLFTFGIVSAQETENGAQAVALDENVTAGDLGVSESITLPDSPLYFFKNLGRAIQNIITLDPVKKAELQGKIVNEKLIELKKLAEKNKNSKVVNKAAESYQKEVEKLKNAADKIKEKAGENNEVGKFLDKFIQQQTLQQRILQKLATQVPTEVLEKITEAREAHLEKFGEVMTKLENKENIQQRLEKNLEEVKGSQFKDFKNLEILRELEEKVPEAAKEAIQRAQENALKRLQGDVEKMSPEDQTKFQDYIEKIGGVKERQMEILDNLGEGLKNKPVIKEILIQTREKVQEKIKERAEGKGCPSFPEPQIKCDLMGGRWIYEKDPETGCPLSTRCVVPEKVNTEKPEACITLWDPVCGKDGKTYSNSCFAKSAGVEIDYENACKSLETGISNQIKEQIKSLIPSVTQ